MFKKLLLCLSVLAAGSLNAASGQFSVTADGTLKYNGKVLISNDFFGRCAGEYSHVKEIQPQNQDTALSVDSKNSKIIVSGGKMPGEVLWSKELAVSPKRAEITWAGVIPPGNYGPDQTMFRYVFSIPCDILKDVAYDHQYGMHRHGKDIRSGKFTGKEPENELIISHIRHITLKGKVNLLIDFSPCGPWGIYQEDPSSSYKAHMVRKGDRYYFLMPFSRAQHGGKASGKIVFITNPKPLNEIHPVDKAYYSWPWPTLGLVQFTPEKPVTGFKFYNYPGYGNDFKAWQKQGYDPKAKMGWIKLPKSKMIKPNSKSSLGPIYSGGITGEGKGEFRMELPDSLVLVSCMLSGRGIIKAGEKSEKFNLQQGKVATVTLPVFIKNNDLRINIDGKWRLSGIVVQLLMFANEDYLFTRKWWTGGKAPWEYSGFKNRADWQKYYD